MGARKDTGVLSHGTDVWQWFSLEKIIPGCEICVNTETRTITSCYARCITSRSHQQVFTHDELALVKALIEHYPYHCPHAMILHAYTGNALDRCQRAVQDAYEAGGALFDTVMRPTRNGISRCRLKLRGFGLDVVNVYEVGYMLLAASETFARRS